MNKTELINLLRDERRQWEALLDEIGPERMALPGVSGDWSFKDVVAHVTGWNHKMVVDLQAAQRGEPEPPPPWPAHIQDEDEINAWIYAAHRDRSVEEVLEESQQVLDQLFAALEALPDDVRLEFVEPAFHLVWVGDRRFFPAEGFHHFRDDHEPDVRAWLARG